ncbi:ABC transporter permease [Jeotgalibacillus terrae]|uniref:ABC transporter permease n=1 Tax=Jeotgalibacillus terrae TaxID=587735 RepID=A0ABW5ZKU5_9BACL|nr:ABC transporter permease [Jeotgalibacillus terrae]MBM7580451.1 ABC-2 type transport system permease protein [Jeotgalibacillus terrae]
MSLKPFYQTGSLIKFYLRTDFLKILIWTISITALTMLTAWAFEDLYPSEAERLAIAETMKNPAMTAMVGPGYGIENYTTGAMMAHQMLLFTAILAAVMTILMTAKHTRGDEEDGRAEMISSLPAGRLAPLTSVLAVVGLSQLLLAVSIGTALSGLNIESMPPGASFLYGAAIGGTGLFFAGVTAVFAQLSESSRGTSGFAFLILGVSYLVRAIGDVSMETLSWLSPLGWALKTEVYVSNLVSPLVLLSAGSSALALAAFGLMLKRDLGSGMLPSKPGRSNASPLLLSPFGLALRLLRTSVIVWAVALMAIGASYGSVLGDLESFFSSNEMLSNMVNATGGLSLTEQFISMLMAIMSMMAAVPALMFFYKLKSEENKSRMENIYARAVSRQKVFLSYLAVAVVFGSLMMIIATVSLWGASVSVMEEPLGFAVVLKSGLVYLPAIWVMIGIGAVFTGIKPGLTGLAWGYLIYSFLVVYLGGLLQLPDWPGQLSPFGHVPQIPGEEISWLSLMILTVISLALTIVGLRGYQQRDLKG